MDKYTQICMYYGITEDAMNNYVYEDYFIESSENIINAKYQDYVFKCKLNNKKPLSKKEWYKKRNKIKKGIAIGSVALTAISTAGILKHKKYVKEKNDKLKAKHRKEMEERYKERQREIQRHLNDIQQRHNNFMDNHNERMKEIYERAERINKM